MAATDLIPGAAAAALYIHIPFCLSKCDYCAFNSYPVYRHDPAAYVEALKGEIRILTAHPLIQGPFDTVYLGGGTPSCLEPPILLDLLGSVRQDFDIVEGAEITMEANPNSIDPEGLTLLFKAGVNRISLGVQSFSERLLKIIGRGHSAEDIHLGVEAIRKAGFTNLSLDLIFGLPGQNLRDLQTSLETALDLAPQHLSLYELMVEENTPLAAKLKAGKLTLPDEDLVAEMAETARSICRKKGLKHYEIANFARDGYRCRHNLHYWHNHDYIGLGAGAVSGWGGLRISNEADPGRFIARIRSGALAVSGMEGLCRQARFRETVIMGLRLTEGLSIEDLENRFHISPLKYYGKELTRLLDMNLIKIEGDRLRLSEKGLPVANQVLSRLV